MSLALPPAVAAIAGRVDGRLRAFLAGESDRWRAVDDEAGDPIDAINELIGGGKRLRPAFCFWAFVGMGGDPEDELIVDAGAALEMLHAAALMHDDVIDRSALRRGRPTAHTAFAARHRGRSWRGDSTQFGEGVAVVAGDLALVYSGHLIAGAPPEAVRVFDEMRLEVNVGQYLDILGAARGDSSADFAGLVCRYKTAKYSVERPLHLGVALAAPGRLPERAPPLSEFGLALGEAFQLRDDLLGVFGDPAATGKPVGDDLREGKATLLATLARERATGRGAVLLRDGLGRADMNDDDISALQGVIEDTGAPVEVEARIARLLSTAHRTVSRLPLSETAREALAELADYAADRDR